MATGVFLSQIFQHVLASRCFADLIRAVTDTTIPAISPLVLDVGAGLAATLCAFSSRETSGSPSQSGGQGVAGRQSGDDGCIVLEVRTFPNR